MNAPAGRDGRWPNTDLAAAIAWFRRNPDDLDNLARGGDDVGWAIGEAAATIVRAHLTRPAAGRDLTAQDVLEAVDAWWNRDRHMVAARLNAIARPLPAPAPEPAPESGPPRYQVGDRVRSTRTGRRYQIMPTLPGCESVGEVWVTELGEPSLHIAILAISVADIEPEDS